MRNKNLNYDHCQECGEFVHSDSLVGIHDRKEGEIFICEDCTEIYLAENWPICFIAGYEININD